ncbi:kunitz-type protease inhibitor 2-like [Passerculus sandwichensis]
MVGAHLRWRRGGSSRCCCCSWGGPGGSAGDPPSGPAALAARCRLPALTGRCRASIPRWFFNASSGSCESFVFGGCGGNGNNFGSERECRESCGAEPGNTGENREGPGNRTGDSFGSERECRESCGAEPGNTALSSPVTTNSTLAELCSAPPVTGPCRAAFPRWFYVPAEKSCREFTYGGCRGNANNHRDERECLRRCRPDGDFSDEFQRFFASKGLFLVALVALVAAVALSLSLARGRCRPKPRAPGAAAGADDRECLMKEPYPA